MAWSGLALALGTGMGMGLGLALWPAHLVPCPLCGPRCECVVGFRAAGVGARGHESVLRDLTAAIAGSGACVDALDTWQLRDVDETTHSGSVQLEPYAPAADPYHGALVMDSDAETGLYVALEAKLAAMPADRGATLA